MAIHDAFVLTRTWQCYDIPAPAQYEDLAEALSTAAIDYRTRHGLAPGAPLDGDFCEIHAMDGVLRVRFDLTETHTGKEPR